MLLCALVSSVLLGFMPSVQPVLRLAGAAYILWLAWCTARASYGFTDTGQARLGFDKGFLLQLLNPKVIVYGLALYSSFLSPLAGRPLALVLFALPLTVVCFCAVSTWALCGAAIRRALVRPRVRILVNTVLVLLLAWCAVDLSGLAGI
jgi:cysteine/O-acetylserine efflux protein